MSPMSAAAATGALLASCGGTRLVVHDPDSGKEILRLDMKHPAFSLAIHPDNKLVAVWGPVLLPNSSELAKSQVTVVEIATGREVLAFDVDAEAGRGIAFSPDGKWLVVGRYFFDAKTGKKNSPCRRSRSRSVPWPSARTANTWQLGRANTLR